MRHVRLRRPHNRQVRRDGRRFLEQLPAGSEATVTEHEYQAFRDRFVEIGAAPSGKVGPAGAEASPHTVREAANGSGAGAGEVSGTGANPDEGSGDDGAGDAPDIEQLRREAGELGIEVNPRWREKRLMQEIDRALAAE